MMTEVDIGDIVRYEGKGYRLRPTYAVVLVTQHIDTCVYDVLVLETNMDGLEGPWSFDPEVLNQCTLLA